MSESGRDERKPSPFMSMAASLPAWARWPLRAVATLVGLIAAAGVAGLMLAAIALSVAYPNLPEISSLTDYRPKVPLRDAWARGRHFI